MIIRAAAHDPKRHRQDDVFKTGMMLLDLAASEHPEHVQVYGVSAIFDLNGVSLAHARQLTPSTVKRAVHAWQNYHCRPKHLEFVNAPIYVNVVLRVFKRFMSEKLRGRVNVHFGGLGALHGVIDPGVLPEEYGGTEGKIAELVDYWAERLAERREWFEEDERFKAEV